MFGPCRLYIPARYVLVGLLFLGLSVTSFVTTNISLAIVAMVQKGGVEEIKNCSNITCSNETDSNNFESTCPRSTYNETKEDDYLAEGPYAWSETVQGTILGVYFYGNACVQLIMGRVADKFSNRWVGGMVMLLGSVLTALVPVVADVGVGLLIALRAITGMTQCILYICETTILIRWIPEKERSLMYCITSCGGGFGLLLCPPIVGWLCKQSLAGGWPLAFYTVGAVGSIWSIAWMVLISDSPSKHPRISDNEIDYILSGIPDHGLDPKEQPKTPWRSMLTSMPVWAYIFSFSTSSWIYYSRLTVLPNYLDTILHYPIQENGLINALINGVFMVCTFASGYIADKLMSSEKLSKTKIRKLMECTGLGGSSLCLLGVIFSGCNTTAVITFLTLSSGFQGLSVSGDNVLAMDLAPALSGTLYGLANTFCSSAGFISPLLTGLILDTKDLDLNTKWDIVFYISAFIGLTGATVAFFLWSAEVQPWDPTYIDPNLVKKELPQVENNIIGGEKFYEISLSDDEKLVVVK